MTKEANHVIAVAWVFSRVRFGRAFLTLLTYTDNLAVRLTAQPTTPQTQTNTSAPSTHDTCHHGDYIDSTQFEQA